MERAGEKPGTCCHCPLPTAPRVQVSQGPSEVRGKTAGTRGLDVLYRERTKGPLPRGFIHLQWQEP